MALVLVGTLAVAWEARHSTFTGDDWGFILDRRGVAANVYLTPHNEHLSALPILVYQILLAVFGARSYAPFVAVLLIIHYTVCLLVYALARRYVGRWVALVPAAILVVLGPAWQDLLWAFQMTYLGSVAAGLGMALCLERCDRYGDLWAGVLLGISILCSSIGLSMIPLAVVMIVLTRPVCWRRLWLVGVPTGLYLLWYPFYGVNTTRASNIPRIPHYVFDAAAAGIASVTGVAQTHTSPFLVSTTWGRYLLVVAVILLTIRIVRGARVAPLTWAALVAAFALWIAEAIEYFPGGREAAQSRYQYTAAVLILVAGFSAAKGVRLGRRAQALLVLATLVVVGANFNMLHSRVAFWSLNSAYDRSEEGSLEISRGVVSPGFQPENTITTALVGDHNITVITAGPYFSAARAFGSHAFTPAQILRQPEVVREAADVVLILGERLHPASDDGAKLDPTMCRSTVNGTADETVARTTLIVRNGSGAPAHLELRRFARLYGFPPFTVPAGSTVAVHLPADHSRIPWHARLLAGAGARLCAH